MGDALDDRIPEPLSGYAHVRPYELPEPRLTPALAARIAVAVRELYAGWTGFYAESKDLAELILRVANEAKGASDGK